MEAASKDPIGNSFMVIPMDQKIPTIEGHTQPEDKDTFDEIRGTEGVALGRKYIFVPNKEGNDKTDNMHEVMHVLTFNGFHSKYHGSVLHESEDGIQITKDIIENMMEGIFSGNKSNDEYIDIKRTDKNNPEEVYITPGLVNYKKVEKPAEKPAEKKE